jgi:MerR family transcriptional regulator, light-induced transcriptional regulator
LLKSRGLKVLYLGGNVPLDDLAFVANLKKPDFCYTHLTTVAHNFNFERYLGRLADKIKNTPVIISGQVVQNYKKSVPQGIVFKHSLQEVTEFIANL